MQPPVFFTVSAELNSIQQDLYSKWPFQIRYFPLVIYSLCPIVPWLKCSFVLNAENMFHCVNMPVRLPIYPLWAPVVVAMFSATMNRMKHSFTFVSLQPKSKGNRSKGEKSGCGSKIQSPLWQGNPPSPQAAPFVASWWGLSCPGTREQNDGSKSCPQPLTALSSHLLPPA